MSLHQGKRIAILQWFNSFSSYDLADISQLSDGRCFLDVIHSVFDRKPNFLFEIGLSPTPAANFGITPDIDSIEEELKYIQNETIDSRNSAHQLSEDGAKEPEVIKVPANEEKRVDTVNPSENIEIIDGDFESERSSDSTLSYNTNFGSSKSAENFETVPQVIMASGNVNSIVSKIDESNIDVVKIYEFVRDFINESYNIRSETIVAYELCPQNAELELSKVAVLILAKVVEHFIELQNEALNTLTLLDQHVQEDIRQCLSSLLEQKKVSKRELTRILTKAAKYKLSPRKSPRGTVTPSRNSPRLRNSLILTPSTEEVYTDSPLKSFFDSPQLKKVLVIKDKELQKVQKNLLVEELKAEDLRDEVDSLKSKLEEKDKEIINLKKDLREQNSKPEESTECKFCIDYKNQCDRAIRQCKELAEECKEKDLFHEEECCRLSSKIRDLELKIKTDETKQLINSFDHLPQLVLEKNEELKQLSVEHQRLYEYFRMMHTELSFILQSQPKLTNDDEPEIPAIELSLPDDGECLGSVIEAENRVLRQRLEFINRNVYNILMKYEISEQFAVDMEQNLNISNRNVLMGPSDLTLMDMNFGIVAEPESTVQTLERSAEDTFFISDSVERRLSLRKRKTRSLSKTPDKSVSKNLAPVSALRSPSSRIDVVPCQNLGSLWDLRQQSPHGNRFSEGNCDSDGLTKSKLSVVLGFNELEYSAKVEGVKKLLTYVKELIKPNGTNGRSLNFCETNFNLKTDEDYLRCLLCIKESLLMFQNRRTLSLKNRCCDQAIEMANKEIIDLKKEIDQLKDKLLNSETLKLKIAQRDDKLQELRNQLSALKLELQDLSNCNKDLIEHNEDLSQKLSTYAQEMERMVVQIKENENYKRLYIALSAEKEANEKRFGEKILVCKKEIMQLYAKRKTYVAAYEKEKQHKKELCSQLENLKNEVIVLRAQKRNADRLFKDANIKCQNYESYISTLEKKEKESTPPLPERPADNRISCTVESNPSTESINIDVQNPFNLKLKVTAGASNVPEPAFFGYSIPVEANNESITSYAGRSTGSFMPCPAEEPHCYLNQSAIGDRDDTDLKVYSTLKRRNSVLPPHMKQSFAVNCTKLVTSSPLAPPREVEENQVVKIEEEKVMFESRQKRRKVAPDNAVAGPSGDITPDSKSKKFKTPSSLRKLMMYKRKRPN